MLGRAAFGRHQALLDYAASIGLKKSDIAPPLWHWHWAIGLPIAPPAFMSFGASGLFQGVAFGIIFTLITGLGVFGDGGWDSERVITGVAAGAFFGVSVGPITVIRARAKLGLRSWREFERELAARGEMRAGA